MPVEILTAAQRMHRRDHDGHTIYLLHFEPAYRHARHYIGWTHDVEARLRDYLAGGGSPLVRAAVLAGVEIQLAATFPGWRHLERRLRRWHKAGQFAAVRASRRRSRAVRSKAQR